MNVKTIRSVSGPSGAACQGSPAKRRAALVSEGRETTARPAGRTVARGFTLVEIMLSLAITATVAAAIAAMLASVFHATSHRADLRRVNVKQAVIASRLNAALRSAKMVLAADADTIVLWMGDSRTNGQPNLSELRRIQWDQTTGELWSYAAPPDLAEVNDTLYLLSGDFDSITTSLMGTTNFPGRLWATGVTDLQITLDDAVPQYSRMVNYTISVLTGDSESEGTYTMSFRSN